MASTGTRKGNREKILISALHTFAEHGYHGASIRDIAADCNLNVPSIYYHFKNKETLFRTVLFETHDRSIQDVAARIDRSGDLHSEVLSIFDSLLKHHKHNPERTRFIFRMVFSAPDDICDEYSEHKGKEFRDFVQKAFSRNAPAENAKLKLLCVIDALESFLLSMSFPNQKSNRMPVYRRTLGFILD